MGPSATVEQQGELLRPSVYRPAYRDTMSIRCVDAEVDRPPRPVTPNSIKTWAWEEVIDAAYDDMSENGVTGHNVLEQEAENDDLSHGASAASASIASTVTPRSSMRSSRGTLDKLASLSVSPASSCELSAQHSRMSVTPHHSDLLHEFFTRTAEIVDRNLERHGGVGSISEQGPASPLTCSRPPASTFLNPDGEDEETSPQGSTKQGLMALKRADWPTAQSHNGTDWTNKIPVAPEMMQSIDAQLKSEQYRCETQDGHLVISSKNREPLLRFEISSNSSCASFVTYLQPHAGGEGAQTRLSRWGKLW